MAVGLTFMWRLTIMLVRAGAMPLARQAAATVVWRAGTARLTGQAVARRHRPGGQIDSTRAAPPSGTGIGTIGRVDQQQNQDRRRAAIKVGGRTQPIPVKQASAGAAFQFFAIPA